MEHPPTGSNPRAASALSGLGMARLITLGVLLALLITCIIAAFLTRDAMQHLPSGRRYGRGANVRKGLVDQTPWQTAQAIAPMATSLEESEFARRALRLADHAVDQAFAAALREASLRAQVTNLSGDALALQQRITQLQQMVKQDQAAVQQLIAAEKQNPSSSNDEDGGSDLDVAKAQLGLDSDQLTDAQQDFDRATGDERPQIQNELAEREAAMKKYEDNAKAETQTSVTAASRFGTLAGRIGAWNRQSTRLDLILKAADQAQSDVRSLTQKHDALEAKAGVASNAQNLDRVARINLLKTQSIERQLLSIYDDRIQTEQQLAAIYQRWADQVRLQHRIVGHLILISSAWVVAVLMAMLLGAALVRRLMRYRTLDRRQRHTLQTILQLSIQILGALVILLIVFGAPHETPTILGLATAALTIALQDFILAFLGWFIIMGKNGIRVGDSVEINGVGGEVIEVGLFSTTLLETGKLAEKGYPTGRHISFLNGFAIRGQFFNFSTTGQWMLDQFEVTVPASDRMAQIVDAILNAVEQITGENVRLAEQEWRRVTKGEGTQTLNASPSVNVRPAGNDFGVEVRYVTRAAERVETRNRLYRRVVELLHQPAATA
jgi:small-conductance mechanosensitive channel